MEYTTCKMKILLYGVNGILENAEENLSELEDIAINYSKWSISLLGIEGTNIKKRKSEMCMVELNFNISVWISSFIKIGIHVGIYIHIFHSCNYWEDLRNNDKLIAMSFGF